MERRVNVWSRKRENHQFRKKLMEVQKIRSKASMKKSKGEGG